MPGLGNNSDHSLISAATASTDVAARGVGEYALELSGNKRWGKCFCTFCIQGYVWDFHFPPNPYLDSFRCNYKFSSSSRLHYNWMNLLPPRQLAEDSPPRVTELSQRLSKVHCCNIWSFTTLGKTYFRDGVSEGNLHNYGYYPKCLHPCRKC